MGTFGGEGQACSWHNMYVWDQFYLFLAILPEQKLKSVILLDVACKLVLSIFNFFYNLLHWFGATIVLPFTALYSYSSGYLPVVANESVLHICGK